MDLLGPLSEPLVFLLLIPVAGAILLSVLPGKQTQLIRFTAIAVATFTLLYAASLNWMTDFSQEGMHFSVKYIWNERLGTSFALGVDGISYPLVLLTGLLVLMAMLASASIDHHVKGYYLLLLLLESATIGVFMAQDWGLFYVFWELVLIPLFFLIDRWGGENRQTAALNFVLYTMGGSVFMLLALLVLFDSTPSHAFSFEAMAAGAKTLDTTEQILIFAGLLIGFGVKMPIFPLHGWLPLAHVEAPSPVSILLSGILLKMGAYGLIRSSEILPLAAVTLQDFLFVLGVIGLLYGGLLAWRQSDMKKMIAYSSVSHMGIVLIGIATLNTQGATGAVYQMVAHGLAAGAMFMLIGLLYTRTKTRDINDYGSLIKVTPRFAFLIILAFVAGMGLPGTAGFVAELHVIIAGFSTWKWWIVLISLGIMTTIIYSLRTIRQLYTGSSRESLNSKMQQVKDLGNLELVAASSLIIVTLWLGLYPSAMLNMVKEPVQQWSTAFENTVLNSSKLDNLKNDYSISNNLLNNNKQ